MRVCALPRVRACTKPWTQSDCGVLTQLFLYCACTVLRSDNSFRSDTISVLREQMVSAQAAAEEEKKVRPGPVRVQRVQRGERVERIANGYRDSGLGHQRVLNPTD